MQVSTVPDLNTPTTMFPVCLLTYTPLLLPKQSLTWTHQHMRLFSCHSLCLRCSYESVSGPVSSPLDSRSFWLDFCWLDLFIQQILSLWWTCFSFSQGTRLNFLIRWWCGRALDTTTGPTSLKRLPRTDPSETYNLTMIWFWQSPSLFRKFDVRSVLLIAESKLSDYFQVYQ